MHRPRWIPLLAFLCAFIAPLAAQGTLRLSAAFNPPAVKPGAETDLVLTAIVTPGFHAYGSKEETNIPVALKPKNVELGGLEAVGAAKVPEGEKKTVLGMATHPLPNVFQVTQRVKVPAGFTGSEATVSGKLDYQICDENSCLPPMKAEFTAKLVVGDAPDEPKLGVMPGLQLDPDAKVTVVASIEPSPARAGEHVRLVLDVTVSPPYHVYGTDEPTNAPVALDPAKLQLGGLQVSGEAKVPAGEKKVVFDLESYPLPRTFRVTQRLLVPAGTQPGQFAISGRLDYAPCDENMCYEADEAPFATTAVIEAGAARAANGAEEPDDVPLAKDDGSVGGWSWWQLILACIGGGLFALVMPCTYPMIPITFSFFTKQADARGGKVLPLALAYGAGIVVMFAMIGALAGVVGSWLVQFAAHWITNFVIGTVFVVFGLSLLGVFTLQPPAFLINAAGKARGAGGLVGVLLMGATLVITSFTCTAPVVGALLIPVVGDGNPAKPIAGMAVFGLTMALPFVFLSLLPGRVRSLPRSGDWMNTLKVSLGFVELAAALKFFSNAEYVEKLMILPRHLFLGIWVAIFTALAGYLWGIVPRAASAIGNGRRAGGLVSLAFAGYCLYGALGNPLDKVMTALAPPYPEITLHDLVVDDYEAAVAKAKKEGKLVLVNFTGFTCVNCRLIEIGVMPTETIAPLLVEHFVEARLHMDNPDVIPADKMARHFRLRDEIAGGRITTPTYVTVDPKRSAAHGKLVEYLPTGGAGAWEAGYREFLEQSLTAAGRALPALPAKSTKSASVGSVQVEARDIQAIVARIAAEKGKPVLVNFWGTWCGPCVAEMPDLLAGTRDFRQRGGALLTVAMEHYADPDLTNEQAVDAVKAKALELGIDAPVLVCTTTDMREIRKALGVELGGLPQTVTWDRAGKFVHQHEGMASREDFAAMAQAAER